MSASEPPTRTPLVLSPEGGFTLPPAFFLDLKAKAPVPTLSSSASGPGRPTGSDGARPSLVWPARVPRDPARPHSSPGPGPASAGRRWAASPVKGLSVLLFCEISEAAGPGSAQSSSPEASRTGFSPEQLVSSARRRTGTRRAPCTRARARWPLLHGAVFSYRRKF